MTDINNMMKWPYHSEDEINAVIKVLRSGKVNYWTGEEGRFFEKEFATFCDTKYAIALANGTVALELALHCLELKKDDEVIVTSRTFLACATAIMRVGATPVFADVDYQSQNVTVETIESVVTKNTKAIIAVHLAGWPCDMIGITQMADSYGIKVIEDCAQAHGAIIEGKPVGSFGIAAAWSFCQDKIMSTGGEGGMITTNDEDIWKKAWAFKDHGKSWDTVYNKKHLPGFRWLHESLGTNWRMTEMQSVIGRLQLGKIQEWNALRTSHAQQILDTCSKYKKIISTPDIPENITHAWYKCYVYVNTENLSHIWSRDKIMKEINNLNVPCFTGSCPEIYLEKVFTKESLQPQNSFPVAKKLGENTLMFLVHPTLTSDNMKYTCETIDAVLSKVVEM